MSYKDFGQNRCSQCHIETMRREEDLLKHKKYGRFIEHKLQMISVYKYAQFSISWQKVFH